MYEFAPNSQIVSWIGHQICNEESNPDLADVCANLAFAFMGLNPDQFNRYTEPNKDISPLRFYEVNLWVFPIAYQSLNIQLHS